MEPAAEQSASIAGRTPAREWSRLRRIQFGVALLVMTGIAVILIGLGSRIIGELESLRSAPQDNVQWSLSQLEVEYLVMADAAELAASSKDPARFAEFSRRFDIFASRLDVLSQSNVFDVLRQDVRAGALISGLETTVDRMIPIVDQSSAEGIKAMPEVIAALPGLRTAVRAVSLAGVKVFADAADARRQSFASLVLWTAMTAVSLIVALVAALSVLLWQSRIAQLRSEEIEVSNLRYKNTINASLDAIIIADAEGSILDINPAAERVFSYSRNAAIGQPMHELIIPPQWRTAHLSGMRRFLKTGERRVLSAGRVELEAMRANGEVFPVELSLGMTETANGPVFIAYVRDISDRVANQRALTEARDEALAAARAKSRFLAVMSHEMRTPLNGMLAVLDLLGETPLDGRQRAYVDTATASGEILQHHIDDVLDITRIEADAVTIRAQWFDLVGLIDEIVAINAPAATTRGVAIEVETALSDRYLFQDRNRLRQIVLNLVGNAVKFTEHGTIRITASEVRGEAGAERLDLVVSDTGIGIASEDLDRIFDEFVTLDPSYNRTAPGYGLGLAITRGIVRAMGGTIAVASTPGSGSRFTVSLPLRKPETPRFTAEILPAAASDRAARHDGARILLCEDNETNRFAAREMLQRVGCVVFEARDGEEAVTMADAERFDLILMDVSMPRVDGLEATRRIRVGNGPNQATAIVGVTAHALAEELQSAREAGMQLCLTKPLRLARLDEALDRFLPHAGPVSATEPGTEDDESAAVLDPEVLAELSEVLAPGVFESRLAAFAEEMKTAIATLTDATARAAFDEIRGSSHAHAGSAAVFGAVGLLEAFRAIEAASKSRDLDAVRRGVAALPDLESATHLAIEALLDDQNDPA